ncbi:MAG: GDSL-type esterase/lipase family protein [Tannerellaceae bacterium]|nr:GDSL-type esterase/lipase family protein [Tannerellaceae bacterium]
MKRIIYLYVFLFTILHSSTAQYDHPFWVNVVYIGNSITQGVIMDTPRKNAPPVRASMYLYQQPNVGEVKFSNQGVSGKTTVDFLPDTGTFFEKVKVAADSLSRDTWATLIFSVMLGTNDSAIRGPHGAPVSPDNYFLNMKKIINELLDLYPECLVVLHRPIWYSPNTHNNSLYLQEGLDRLQSYFPQIDQLVDTYAQTHPERVYAGDKEAFDFFKENHKEYFFPENGNSGTFYLHPNAAGAAKLGQFWGKALYDVLIKKSNSP